jgi:hypothetical protein
MVNNVTGFLVIPIRCQNACVILRKKLKFTAFEIFEVDPPNSKVMGAAGKVTRTFPDKAIEIPTSTLENHHFRQELASFLAQMDMEILDSTATSKKAGTQVQEPRDTADPHYITDLFFVILRGHPDAVPSDTRAVRKRIENDIVWHDAYLPWRRSPLWLILRVSIQTSIYHLTNSDTLYKRFMLYLTSELLCLAIKCDFPSHVLHCLRVKVARKLAKLQEDVTNASASRVLGTIKAATSLMETRWNKVQEAELPHVHWAPSELDIQGDTHLFLFRSRAYMKECYSRITKQPPPLSEFQPLEHVRLLNTPSHPAFASEALSSALLTDRFTALADVESSVQIYLDEWMGIHQHDPNVPTILSSCIETYGSSARSEYEGNPEDMSVMFLTILDLWVALDRVATFHHSLLLEYSPEVPVSLLNPLLLRSAWSIQRYKNIQAYIQERHQNSLGHSAFSDSSHHSFAARYFDSSSSLQNLKRRIEIDAETQKQIKLTELKERKAAYESALRRAKTMEHSSTMNRKGNASHRPKKCEKCRVESSAAKMDILVYEWPLSSDNLQAKCTVFELQTPLVFQIWRRTTYAILYEYCRPGLTNKQSDNAKALLETYHGLSQFASGIDRITFGSVTKSFGKSHYKSISVAYATPDGVILPNGLRFQLYDTSHQRWVANSFRDCKIEPACSWKLPADSPYRNLQYAISDVDHTSNRVIAEQCTAPPEVGTRLLWLMYNT